MGEQQQLFEQIQEMKPGEKVTSFFVLRKKELKTKRTDQTPYLLLELGDRSGRITATLWDDARTAYDALAVGDVVKVMGTVMVYNNTRQVSVEKIRKAEEADGVDPKDFVRTGQKETEALYRRLTEVVASVQNPFLKRLLARFFDDAGWVERFKTAPGGKLWHHAHLGGLLEHTVAVVAICEEAARLYPEVDRDLLVTGAVLHDIGKVEEYRHDQGFIDYSDEGRLWGHIFMAGRRVMEIVEEMEKSGGFPEELKKRLVHMVLSHQGKLEQGSPVVPMFPEAVILYYADEMDSKVNGVKHVIERDSEPGRRWSKYVSLLERFIYMGGDEEGG